MNDGVCSKCELLHWGYCDALAHNLLNDDFRVNSDITACRQFLASQNKVVLCDTCTCLISQNSMNVLSSECNEANYYMPSLTKDCEYFAPSYYIVQNHSGNLCVPFSTPAVGQNMYSQCIAKYFRVKDNCAPCQKRTFSTSSRDQTCSIWSRSLTTKYEGSIPEDDCAFCSKPNFDFLVIWEKIDASNVMFSGHVERTHTYSQLAINAS